MTDCVYERIERFIKEFEADLCKSFHHDFEGFVGEFLKCSQETFHVKYFVIITSSSKRDIILCNDTILFDATSHDVDSQIEEIADYLCPEGVLPTKEDYEKVRQRFIKCGLFWEE
jgi:hypothetical protein